MRPTTSDPSSAISNAGSSEDGKGRDGLVRRKQEEGEQAEVLERATHPGLGVARRVALDVGEPSEDPDQSADGRRARVIEARVEEREEEDGEVLERVGVGALGAIEDLGLDVAFRNSVLGVRRGVCGKKDQLALVDIEGGDSQATCAALRAPETSARDCQRALNPQWEDCRAY